MNFPLEFGIGDYKLGAHVIFETLAFVVGFRYYLFFRKKSIDAIDEPNRIWVIIGAAFGAFLFSRLVGSLENPNAWAEAQNKLLYFYANKTIVGGLLGGLIGVELTKIFIGEKSSSGDLFTLPIIVAMIIGRIGCFSSGVYEPTFGIETNAPWGMNLGDGLLRHPVALYEIFFLTTLWFALRKLLDQNHFKSGVVFKFFMVSYLIFRFLLEWIKPGATVVLGLTTIQIACILGLIYYGKTIFMTILNRNQLMPHG